MSRREVLPGDNVIDSRDVIERIDELIAERDDFADDPMNHGKDWEIECLNEADELESLEDLATQAAGYAPDWQYGALLINEDYFEEYARELAYDIGAVDPDAVWPQNCIDWELAATQLKQDYTRIEWEDELYWVR